MRFAYSRRTFLTAVLLVTLTGKVLAEDRVLELAIHDAESPAKPPVLSVLQNDQVVVRLTSTNRCTSIFTVTTSKATSRRTS
jgi:hypothetical protein